MSSLTLMARALDGPGLPVSPLEMDALLKPELALVRGDSFILSTALVGLCDSMVPPLEPPGSVLLPEAELPPI